MTTKSRSTTVVQSFVRIAAIGLIWLVVCTDFSEAAQKKITNGCTPEQTVRWLVTTAGKACMKLQEQDIINNRPYFHAVFCGCTTAACCKVTNGQASECHVLSSAPPPATGQGAPATGGVKPGVKPGSSSGGTSAPPNGTLNRSP